MKIEELPEWPDRCDVCAADGREVKVRRFMLLVGMTRADGRRTTRGAGSIVLCEPCWKQTAGRRRRRTRKAA